MVSNVCYFSMLVYYKDLHFSHILCHTTCSTLRTEERMRALSGEGPDGKRSRVHHLRLLAVAKARVTNPRL